MRIFLRTRVRPAALAGAILFSLGLILVAPVPAFADREEICGQSVPENHASVDDLITKVRKKYPGRFLRMELESEGEACDDWRYEIKMLTEDGHVLMLEYDAITLELLEFKGRRSRHEYDNDDDDDDDDEYEDDD